MPFHGKFAAGSDHCAVVVVTIVRTKRSTEKQRENDMAEPFNYVWKTCGLNTRPYCRFVRH